MSTGIIILNMFDGVFETDLEGIRAVACDLDHNYSSRKFCEKDY